MKESKNEKQLNDFIDYCKVNPEMRFFQALRNWIQETVDKKWNWLLVSSGSEEEDTFFWK